MPSRCNDARVLIAFHRKDILLLVSEALKVRGTSETNLKTSVRGISLSKNKSLSYIAQVTPLINKTKDRFLSLSAQLKCDFTAVGTMYRHTENTWREGGFAIRSDSSSKYKTNIQEVQDYLTDQAFYTYFYTQYILNQHTRTINKNKESLNQQVHQQSCPTSEIVTSLVEKNKIVNYNHHLGSRIWSQQFTLNRCSITFPLYVMSSVSIKKKTQFGCFHLFSVFLLTDCVSIKQQHDYGSYSLLTKVNSNSFTAASK